MCGRLFLSSKSRAKHSQVHQKIKCLRCSNCGELTPDKSSSWNEHRRFAIHIVSKAFPARRRTQNFFSGIRISHCYHHCLLAPWTRKCSENPVIFSGRIFYSNHHLLLHNKLHIQKKKSPFRGKKLCSRSLEEQEDLASYVEVLEKSSNRTTTTTTTAERINIPVAYLINRTTVGSRVFLYQCTKCDYSSEGRYSNTIRDHVRRKHLETPPLFKCSVCDKKYRLVALSEGTEKFKWDLQLQKTEKEISFWPQPRKIKEQICWQKLVA